jgi:hypothetical protein
MKHCLAPIPRLSASWLKRIPDMSTLLFSPNKAVQLINKVFPPTGNLSILSKDVICCVSLINM